MSALPDNWGANMAEQLRQEAEADVGRRGNDLDALMNDNPDSMGLPITWLRDYPAVRHPDTIVEGLLEAGSLALVYGEANCGKSTFALDIGLCVAHGAPWRGRCTRRGVVLWLALEAPAGLRRRAQAYRRHRVTGNPDILFCDVKVPVRLLDIDHVRALLRTAGIAETMGREPVALIVVDTVARAMAGGDENDGRDMGLLIAACDLIRKETGATVLLVHHSGKDSTRGARGHSSLRAAVDTEIEISGQQNPRQAKVTKQRDLPSGDVFAFDLEPVEVGTDPATGEPITACVVTHRDDVAPTRKQPSGRNQQQLLAAIREHVRTTGSDLIATPDLREIAKAQGLADRRRFGEARETLERDGWLVPAVGGHRFSGDKL